jgi:hypothetical protein
MTERDSTVFPGWATGEPTACGGGDGQPPPTVSLDVICEGIRAS